jgi:hypothetical protein
MNARHTLILIALLIVLGGYIYFFKLGHQEEARDESEAIKIYGTTYGEYDLVELEFTDSAGQTAAFVRTDETPTLDWAMLRPMTLSPVALDQAHVNGAATRLARLTASQLITDVARLSEYGLDAPVLTVTLTISNGQKITLQAGKPTPVGGNRYVRPIDEIQSVYVIPSFAIDDLLSILETPPLVPTPLPTVTPSPGP